MRKTRRYNQKSKKDFRGLANSAPRLRQSSNQVRPAFGPLATKALAGRMSARDSNEQRSRSGCPEVPRPHRWYPLLSRFRAGPYRPTDLSWRLAGSPGPAAGPDRTVRGPENFQLPPAPRVPAASAQLHTLSRLAPGTSIVV